MTPGWRRAGLGLGLALLYAIAAGATHGVVPSPWRRPLYDGFAPPPPYRWVKPPPAFAAGNAPPEPVQRSIPLGPAGSQATNASTNDAQIIVGLPDGALAAHPSDKSVLLTITPLDPATLAPLPPGQAAVSNAYSLTLAYEPSQAPITTLASAANATVALTAGLQGENLLYSFDGHEWDPVDARPFGNTHGLTGAFIGPGYYVVTGSPSSTTTRAPGTAGGGSGAAGTVVGVVVIVLVVVVAVAAGLWFRRRHGQTARGPRPGGGRGRKGGGRPRPRRRS